MPVTGRYLCDGCSPCRTDTIQGDDEAHDWPCCDVLPDNKAPCRFAWITRCAATVDIGIPNCITDTNRWPLTYAVTELRKACYVGCTWVHRPTCGTLPGGGDEPGFLLDVTPGAMQTFPPAHRPPITYHPGDYRTDSPCLAPNECFGEIDPDCVNSLNDNWTMTVSGTAEGDVEIELTEPSVVAWALANSKPIPVYTNVGTFDPWGRTRFDIDTETLQHWTMLQKSTCVVFLDEPGAEDNPCDDQDSRCVCNDFEFGDSVILYVNIVGCDSISGLQTVTLTRYKSPTSLPCGVSYPESNPCGVFLGTLSTGDGCTSAEVNWSGAVLVMLYCDPSNPEQPYKIKLYCYSTDTECWVEQGDGTITLLEKLCWGLIYLEFTLPELDCCCPEDVVTCGDCDNIPTELTAEDGDGNIVTLTYNPESSCWEYTDFTNSFGGCPAPVIIAFCCSGGTFFGSVNASATTSGSLVDCEAFEWSGSGPSPCDPFPVYTMTVTL